MKKCFLLIFCLSALLGQSQISERLQNAVNDKPNDLFWISLEFPNYVDAVALRNHFDQRQMTSAERLRFANRIMMKQAQFEQKEALSILKDPSKGEVLYIHSFYAVNRIVAQVDVQMIGALSTLQNIQLIDLAEGEIEFFEPVTIKSAQTNKTSGLSGPEPGILAINSPAMWNLGYTGRGRKVFIYDSGVWPKHPAVSNRFLGNFRPMDQSWYGYFIDEPNGNMSNHGTHVLGTVAGLDLATSDTIGSAFKSYWMACDLINSSSAAGLPPQVELIAAFEWALNPDGDTSTTDDVPDVINNSWRWYDPIDTNECNGFIPQLMTTIELAGIANVFSGGNTGPNNAGVNSPQRINTTEINTFTVGAVNANVSYPFPIASFSTRGPTQCGGTGSLNLYPEVVAPGQDVRSSVGMDGYALFSGTSMASPHVSGALLLLKEAFPTLGGDQLISAIYNSAIDFGPTGEDNTFGKGLIDVHAAYQLLAQTNTPVNPNNVDWDVAIYEINYPPNHDILCEQFFSPGITLMNLGSMTIDTVWMTITDNGVPTASTPSMILTPGFSAGSTHTLATNLQFPIGTGEHVWSFQIDINKPDYDLVNNQHYVRFKKLNESNLMFLEDFESGLDSNKWHIDNPDYLMTWDTTQVLGWPGNLSAATMNLANYNQVQNQRDGLWTMNLELPATVPSNGQIALGFHVAYQNRGIAFLQDTLVVRISEDCGKTFPHEVFRKSTTLATVPNTGNRFVPQDASEWRREHIDLSGFAGSDVVISFESINRNGNNIYIDNISVYDGTVDPFEVDEFDYSSISVYPNPASKIIRFELGDQNQVKGRIFDVSGNQVTSFVMQTSEGFLDVSELANGVYIIEMESSIGVEHIRFVKQ